MPDACVNQRVSNRQSPTNQQSSITIANPTDSPVRIRRPPSRNRTFSGTIDAVPCDSCGTPLERCRTMVPGLFQDLKHSARMLLKNPGFTFVAMVSIAIGVGANAAMFSMADALVLRPLPVPQPGGDHQGCRSCLLRKGLRNPAMSYRDYVDVRDGARSFSALAAYQLVAVAFSTAPTELAQRKVGVAASENLLEAAGVTPGLGRWFRADENQVAGRNPVVVLAHDTWTRAVRRRPGRDRSARPALGHRLHGDRNRAGMIHRARCLYPSRLLCAAGDGSCAQSELIVGCTRRPRLPLADSEGSPESRRDAGAGSPGGRDDRGRTPEASTRPATAGSGSLFRPSFNREPQAARTRCS